MPRDFDRITRSSPDSSKDEQIAALEDDLQSEKDGRNNDRFLAALGFIILFDSLIFRDTSWVGSLVVLFFEILLILVLAKRLGVEEIATHILNAIDYTKKLREAVAGPKLDNEPASKPEPSAPAANTPSIDKTQDDGVMFPSPSDTERRC